jgi:hypothetical protein
MKRGIAIALLTAAALALGQSGSVPTAQPDPSRVLGVWRATLDGLPAFTLSVTDEGGELQGAILFYLIKREKPGAPPTATPGVPGPIFHPVFDGKTLRFEVSHRGAHPPRTLHDTPVPFELTLDANGQAVVQNKWEGMTLRVAHSDY